MKPLTAGACAALVLFVTAAAPRVSAQPAAPLSENEQAGLPNLETLNGTMDSRASASSKLEMHARREPSFYHRDPAGTEIEEFRDRGKSTEIDVRSNFGTRYQMTAPADISPSVRQNQGIAAGRVPAVSIKY
jgi:hypothetical protein